MFFRVKNVDGKTMACLECSLVLLYLFCMTTVIYFKEFVDESDTLAVSAYMIQGECLYRDLFSHHFPLAYYFTACIFKVTGPAFEAARFCLYLLQCGMFALVMMLTRRTLLVSISVIAWGIVGPYFLWHMDLYQVFATLAVWSAAFLVLCDLIFNDIQSPFAGYFLGICMTLAVLADPLTVFPFGLIMIVWWTRQHTRTDIIQPLLILAAGLTVVAGLLITTDSATDFYEQVILFNQNVYSQYTPTRCLDIHKIIRFTGSLLDLFPGKWIIPLLKTNLLSPNNASRYLLTGVLFRAGIVILSMSFLSRKRWGCAFFTYFITVLACHKFGQSFRGQLLYFWGITCIVVGLSLKIFPWKANVFRPRTFGSNLHRLMDTILMGCRYVAGAGLVALTVQAGIQTKELKPQFTLSRQFKPNICRAIEFKRLARDVPGVRIADYPGGVATCFHSDLKHLNRHLYLWPWVADAYMPEIVAGLKGYPAIIHLNAKGSIWNIPIQRYLKPLTDSLCSDYYYIGNNIYLSPELVQMEGYMGPFPQSPLVRIYNRNIHVQPNPPADSSKKPNF